MKKKKETMMKDMISNIVDETERQREKKKYGKVRGKR